MKIKWAHKVYSEETFKRKGSRWESVHSYCSFDFDNAKNKLQKYFPTALIEGKNKKTSYLYIGVYLYISVYFKDKADEAEFICRIKDLEISLPMLGIK